MRPSLPTATWAGSVTPPGPWNGASPADALVPNAISFWDTNEDPAIREKRADRWGRNSGRWLPVRATTKMAPPDSTIPAKERRAWRQCKAFPAAPCERGNASNSTEGDSDPRQFMGGADRRWR